MVCLCVFACVISCWRKQVLPHLTSLPPFSLPLFSLLLDNRGKKSLTKNEKTELTNPFLQYIVRLVTRYPDFIDGFFF